MANVNNLVIFIFLISLLIRIDGQVLNPNYFNIAEGRKVRLIFSIINNLDLSYECDMLCG